MNSLMTNAFALVYYAIAGVIVQFSRLFTAFSLGEIVFPVLLISVIFAFVIQPFVSRAHTEGIENIYLKSKIGFHQTGSNYVRRRANRTLYNYHISRFGRKKGSGD